MSDKKDKRNENIYGSSFMERVPTFFNTAYKKTAAFIKKHWIALCSCCKKIYSKVVSREFWHNMKERVLNFFRNVGTHAAKYAKLAWTKIKILFAWIGGKFAVFNDKRDEKARLKDEERKKQQKLEYEEKKKILEDQKIIDEAMKKVDEKYKTAVISRELIELPEENNNLDLNKNKKNVIVATLASMVAAVSMFFKKLFAKKDKSIESQCENIEEAKKQENDYRLNISSEKLSEKNENDQTVILKRETEAFLPSEEKIDEKTSIARHTNDEKSYGNTFFSTVLDSKRLQKRADVKVEAQKGDEEEEKHSMWERDRRPFFLVSIGVSVCKALLLVVVLAGFAGLGVAFGVLRAYIASAPELSVEKIENNAQTSFIYDYEGNLLYEYYNLENRSWASADEIPTLLKYAVVASEDESFFEHSGFNLKRIIGSAIGNFTGSSYAGGSTITQQVLKLTLLTSQQTYKRKIQEIYLAYQLEQQYTKEEILEWYMNIMPMGGLLYGVKAAAEDYFGKDLNDLTLRECAILAGMTNAPTRYNPRTSLKSVEEGGFGEEGRLRLYKRGNYVLTQMYAVGFINKEDYEAALFDEDDMESEQLTVKPSSTRYTYDHKYYVEYVLDELVKKIMDANDWEGDIGKEQARSVIRSGGLKIYTAFNEKTQTAVENAVYSYKNWPPLANPSSGISAGGVEQPQCATVVIDNSTGFLAAIVGGRKEPDARLMLNRAYQSILPIGSSIKPMSVYAPALDQGVLGNMIIENIPASIDGWVSELGYPVNSDGEDSYHGPTSISFALVKSMNIPTARILIERLGVNKSYSYLQALGFSDVALSLSPSLLALGSTGGYLIDTVSAFATLANDGVYREPLSIIKIIDKNNEELFSYENQVHRKVFKSSTVYIITQWLHRAASKPEAALNVEIRSNKGIEVAGKTGTNEKVRGIGYIGYTKYYTCGVWIGHDDFTPGFKEDVSALYHATPFWMDIMDSIHEGLESTKIYENAPADVIEVTICPVSGKLPNGDLCSHGTYESGLPTSDRHYKQELKTEYFIKGTEPTEVCDMHIAVDYCKITGMLATEYCDDDCRESGVAVVLPEDSEYFKLIGSKYEYRLHMYFPLYFVNGVPYTFEGIADKSEYKGQITGEDCYCKYHTKETQDLIKKKDALTKLAESKIREINLLLRTEKYAENIGSMQLEKINKAIEYVNICLNKPIYSTGNNDDVFKLSDAQEAYDALASLADKTFKYIDEVLTLKAEYKESVNMLIRSVNTKLNNVDYAVVITSNELIEISDFIKALNDAMDAPAYDETSKDDPSVITKEHFTVENLLNKYEKLKSYSEELFAELDKRIDSQVVIRDDKAITPYTNADTQNITNELLSKNAILIDAVTGRIIAGRGYSERIYPESMTKIMSVLVAYEYIVDKNINVNNTYVEITKDILQKAEGYNSSMAGFVEGEKVALKDLFYGVIVSSGADAAVALAEYCAGNEVTFVGVMNKKAAALGLKNTHFTSSVGTLDTNNYSTVKDMAVVFARALSYDFIRTVVGAQSYTYPRTNKQVMRTVRSLHTSRRTSYNINLKESDVEGVYEFGGFSGAASEMQSGAATYVKTNKGETYIVITSKCDLYVGAIEDYLTLYYSYAKVNQPDEPEPTETPDPTDVPNETIRPEPTDTPKPADTIDPTETPDPTDIPEIIETPDPVVPINPIVKPTVE